MAKYSIGVDVGGTTVKIGVLDLEGSATEILIKRAIPTRTENDGVHILPDIAEAVLLILEELGAGPEDVERLGAGVPGPVFMDPETGHMIVNCCVNLGWSMPVDMTAELEELTGIHNISVTNDANAAALGEVIAGSCRDRSVVVVTIGTGIGGGIVQRGEILQGAYGAAGEIGHMKVQPQHELIDELAVCGLKPFADLEYYTSATGIARVAKAAVNMLPDASMLRDVDDIDAKSVFDAAKEGDALALKVTDFFFDTLGLGLASVASVVDPDIFMIGGGVAGAGEFLREGLRQAYLKYVFHASRDAEFRLAVLGNDAGIIGAAFA